MQKSNRKKLVIVGGAALLLAVAIVLLTAMRPRDAAVAGEDETVTAFIGNLAANATASGTLLAAQESTLSAKTPGMIEAVFVDAGDRVAAGEPLVQLETSDLALNVRLSQQNVRLKEANLNDLLAGAGKAQVAAAEAAVLSAQSQLDDLLSGPSAEEIAALDADLKSAEANTWSSSAQVRQMENTVKESDIAAARAALVSAQANLTSVEIQYTRNPSPDDIQASNALAQAREQVNSAQARLDSLLAGPDANQLGSAQAGLSAATAQQDAAVARHDKALTGATTAEIAAAEAQLAQAEASLADMVNGPTTEQIAAAEAELAQARIELENAESALEETTIRAPFDGLVSDVFFVEGERASGPVVSLLSAGNMEVVLEVDEADVAKLRVGQAANISFEAFPDSSLTAKITAIAPKASGGSGSTQGSALVVYEVHLALEESALPLRSGMTADADLIVAKREGVLLVPNQAINADRASGTYSVNRVSGETVEEVQVVIGLRDGQYTQIINGLNEGDVLVVGNEAPIESAIPTRRGPFGGE
jgi:HlyD family secretion protein